MQERQVAHLAWLFFIVWVVGTSTAGVLGLLAVNSLVDRLPEGDYRGDNGIGALGIWAYGLVFFAGTFVGATQGFLLWLFNQVEGTRAFAWVLGTWGSVFLLLLVLVAGSTSLVCVVSMLPGIMFGLPQWLLLRNKIDLSAWWLGANALGWLAAVLVGWYVFVNVLPDTEVWFPFYPAQAATHWVIASAAGIVPYAILTAFVLAWHMRKAI